MDLKKNTKNWVKPVECTVYPKINTEQIKTVRRLQNKKASGPDYKKREMYKILLWSNLSTEILRRCLHKETDKEDKPGDWKMSNTKMLSKISKPIAKHLRLIALYNNCVI